MQPKSVFFERLLLLPLFQGIGKTEFWEIAERIRIGFQKLSREALIVEQDTPCDVLHFILSGNICVRQTSNEHTYILYEYFDQPMVIQPEARFGLRTRYTRTFSTTSSTELLKVEKAAVRDILFYYPTFRINYLNMVSTQMQQASLLLWRATPNHLNNRFVRFLINRSLRPAGHKVLKIKMEQLAWELNETRLNVSRMLHDLQDKKLVEMRRGNIVIPSFEALIQNYG